MTQIELLISLLIPIMTSHCDSGRVISVLIGERGSAYTDVVRFIDWFTVTAAYGINRSNVYPYKATKHVRMAVVRSDVKCRVMRYYAGMRLYKLTRNDTTIWCLCTHKYNDDVSNRGGTHAYRLDGKWVRNRRALRVIDILPSDIRECMYDIAGADTYALSQVELAPNDCDVTYDDSQSNIDVIV